MKNPLSSLFGNGKPATGSAGTVLRGAGVAALAGAPAVSIPSSQTVAAWTAGSIVLEDYQVLGQLGKGSFGHVYLLVLSQSTRQRFAVKRAFIASDQERRLFLDELKNWIDLPEHPHLVSCRFLRTAGSEIVIFADYVAGGDLSKWIRAGKLKGLEPILDVAIQFAWGLHAAHELEVIHQDVKPGNALMTPGGVVRVADFGLARARSRVSGQAEHSGGYTEAYCSPEQLRGEEVSRRSDLWSWGASVMEMLAGGVSWKLGFEAATALEQFIRAQATLANGQRAFPPPVAEVLRRCFRDAPEDRWPTLLAAAQALEASYQSLTGQPYPRSAPQFPRRDTQRAQLDRRTGNTTWGDPREWLKKGLQAVGRDPAEAERIAHSGQDVQSLKAQAIADLGNYQQAQLLFEQAIAGGRADLREQLAVLCMNRALVHVFVEDPPGALGCYDIAIAIRERLVNEEGQRVLAANLADACLNKATLLYILRNLPAAVKLFDQAIALYERLVNREGRREQVRSLALAYENKANAVNSLRDPQAAVALFDQAIALYERLVNQEGRRELTLQLAGAYMNKANAINSLRNRGAAVALFDQSIALFERLVNQEGHHELAPNLARVYMNKANCVGVTQNPQAAVPLYDQSIALYEGLVNREGRRAHERELAGAYLNKAITVAGLGNPSVGLYNQSISLYERLVHREGRRELAPELAMTYLNKADAVRAQGNLALAVALCDQAIAVYEHAVNEEGRRDLTVDLAAACNKKAGVVKSLGKPEAAVALYTRCIELYQALVDQEGQRGLTGELAAAIVNLAIALKELGDRLRAAGLARTAIALLEAEVRRTGQSQSQNLLSRARQHLGDLLTEV